VVALPMPEGRFALSGIVATLWGRWDTSDRLF
jgi:hypothetical protein